MRSSAPASLRQLMRSEPTRSTFSDKGSVPAKTRAASRRDSNALRTSEATRPSLASHVSPSGLLAATGSISASAIPSSKAYCGHLGDAGISRAFDGCWCSNERIFLCRRSDHHRRGSGYFCLSLCRLRAPEVPAPDCNLPISNADHRASQSVLPVTPSDGGFVSFLEGLEPYRKRSISPISCGNMRLG